MATNSPGTPRWGPSLYSCAFVLFSRTAFVWCLTSIRRWSAGPLSTAASFSIAISLFCSPLSVAMFQKGTSKGLWQQGIVLKHRNSLQRSLCPVVICPYLCSSDMFQSAASLFVLGDERCERPVAPRGCRTGHGLRRRRPCPTCPCLVRGQTGSAPMGLPQKKKEKK